MKPTKLIGILLFLILTAVANSASYGFSPSTPTVGERYKIYANLNGDLPSNYDVRISGSSSSSARAEKLGHGPKNWYSYTTATKAGTATIYFKLFKDGSFDRNIDNKTLTIKALDPKVTTFTASPSSPTKGESITFTAKTDISASGVRIKCGNGSWHSTSSSNSNKTWKYTRSEGLQSSNTCYVDIDGDGSSDKSLYVSVSIPNPKVTTFTASPSSPTKGESITFTAKTDISASGVRIKCGNGSWHSTSSSNSNKTWRYIRSEGLQSSNTCYVDIDGDGSSDKSLYVSVSIPNPKVTTFRASPSSPKMFEPITFTAKSDIATSNVKFKCGNGSWFGYDSSSNGSKTWTYTRDVGLKSNATCYVDIDGDGDSDKSLSLSVGNPKFSISKSISSIKVGDDVKFTVVTDTIESGYKLQVKFSSNGNWFDMSPSSNRKSWTKDRIFEGAGSKTVYFQILNPSSNEIYNTTLSFSVESIKVGVESFRATPSTAKMFEPITFVAVADKATSNVKFKCGGGSWQSSTASNSNKTWTYTRDVGLKGTTTCYVDIEGDGVSDDSFTVNVGNPKFEIRHSIPTPKEKELVTFTVATDRIESGYKLQVKFSTTWQDMTPNSTRNSWTKKRAFESAGSKTVLFQILNPSGEAIYNSSTTLTVEQNVVEAPTFNTSFTLENGIIKARLAYIKKPEDKYYFDYLIYKKDDRTMPLASPKGVKTLVGGAWTDWEFSVAELVEGNYEVVFSVYASSDNSLLLTSVVKGFSIENTQEDFSAIIDFLDDKPLIAKMDLNANQEKALSRSDAIVLVDQMRILLKNSIEKDMQEYYNPFADVPQDAEYLPSLMRLSYYKSNFEQTVISKDTLFNPMRHTSREEFIKIAMNGFDIPEHSYNLSAFSDNNEIVDWARKYFETAVYSELLVGNEGKLLPKEKISIKDALRILRRIKEKFSSNYPFDVSRYETPESLDLSSLYHKTIGFEYEPRYYKPDATPIKITSIEKSKSGNFYVLTVHSTIDSANEASDYYWWTTDKGYFKEVASNSNYKIVHFYPMSTKPTTAYHILVKGGDNLGFVDSQTITIEAEDFSYPEDSKAVTPEVVDLEGVSFSSALVANKLFVVDLSSLSIKKTNLELGIDQVTVSMNYNGKRYPLFHGTPNDKKARFVMGDYAELYGQTVSLDVEIFSQAKKTVTSVSKTYLPQFSVRGKVYNAIGGTKITKVVIGSTEVALDENDEFYYTLDSNREVQGLEVRTKENSEQNHFEPINVDLTYESSSKYVVLTGEDARPSLNLTISPIYVPSNELVKFTLTSNENIPSNATIDLEESACNAPSGLGTKKVEISCTTASTDAIKHIVMSIGSNQLYGDGLSRTVVVDSALNSANAIETVKAQLLLSSVAEENLDLPTEMLGVAISWSSSNPSVLSETGQVTRQDTEQNVTLTATLSKDNVSDTKTFEITVPAKEGALDTDGDGIPDSEDLDDDGDGISDEDELKYGLDPLNKDDALLDSDGDGVSNLDEIKAGTNPKDGNDYPSINHKKYMKVAWFLDGKSKKVIPDGVKGKIVQLFTWWGDHSIKVDLNNDNSVDYDFNEDYPKKDVASEKLDLNFTNGFTLQDYELWTNYWEDPTHKQVNCWATNSDGTCKYKPNGAGAVFLVEDNKFECKDNVWKYNNETVSGEEIYCIEYETDLNVEENQTTFSYRDDFNDINQSFWYVWRARTNGSADYSALSILNGELTMNQDRTDSGPNMISKPIKVDKDSIVTVKRRVFIHPHYSYSYQGGDIFFSGGLSIKSSENIFDSSYDKNLANVSYLKYEYQGKWDTFTLSNRDKTETYISSVWDDYFDEELIYNVETGLVTYKVNGKMVSEILETTTKEYIKIYMQTYGWWTGHYTKMDYIDIKVQSKNDICAEVLTQAYNPTTGEEKEFSSPCTVPDGWIVGNAPDFDGDGENDILDLDDDNDGILDIDDVNRTNTDSDGDGLNDFLDSNDTNPDTDGDGILDGADHNATNPNDPVVGGDLDTDNDGIVDGIDTDDDNDGVLDIDDVNRTNPDMMEVVERFLILNRIDDIYILENGIIPPMSIEVNASQIEKVSYSVSSSNDLVLVNVENNQLVFDIASDRNGSSSISLVAKMDDKEDRKEFVVYVANSGAVIIDPLTNRAEEVSGSFEITQGEVQVIAEEEENGVMSYQITQDEQTTSIDVNIAGVKPVIDGQGEVTITVPSSKKVVIKIEDGGEVNIDIENAILPSERLPQGTKVTIENNRIEFDIQMPNKLSF